MSTAQSYDNLPYPGAAFSQTHPSRLAAVAILHGVDAPDSQNCRVLELGCSDGGNLLNIAYTLPDAECVGIDYAPVHITAAERSVAALNLKNCRFYTADILNLPQNLGSFDYIITHGVYSWVPPDVQQAIMRIYAELLTPHGIGYISYNAYPGWHGYRMIREVLESGIPPTADIYERIGASRTFLQDVKQIGGSDNTAYSAVVNSTSDSFGRSNDAYLGHEYFEDDNTPSYFHEFIEKARNNGLEYVAEAFSQGTQLHNAPERVLQEISNRASDRIEREQWLDFFIGRQFRKTLLCKAESNSPHELDNSNFKRLYIGSSLTRTDDSPEGVPQYAAPNGLVIGSGNPTLARAIAYLAECNPLPVTFSNLLRKSGSSSNVESDEETIIALCRQCYDDMLGYFYDGPTLAVAKAGAYPKISDVARLQALSGNVASTLHHSAAQFDEPVPLILLRNADGTRSQDELFDLLKGSLEREEFKLADENGNPLATGTETDEILRVALEVCMEQFAKFALLEK
ncbi:class I SAM-dependent methyltransferase [Ignavibacteria bacterium]|nr:methyltransferase regulatory domain-containing protein [Bacteroidota bacterium]MCZ2133065.1 class I SAM-dependent methyltransferase [Bacteroidota bacterium]